MPLPSLSALRDPSGETYGVPSKLSAAITLGSLMHPMTALHPAPDATNGPLKSDAHMVVGAPASTTGLRFIPWNQAGAFRTQGMNWIAANTAANNSGTSCAINGSTPRTWGYGTSQPNLIESDHDFAWITDSAVVIVQYFHWNGYTGSNQHDMRWCVEHENSLKQLRSNLYPNTPMPSSVTTQGGMHNRRIEFTEQRERQHRVFLPANCFVAGVWIDATANIRKAPPAPFHMAYSGDSWGEPYRNNPSLQSPVAGAYPTGTYTTTSLPTELALATGWVIARIAGGGTGEWNANDTGARALSYSTATGDSVFYGDLRMTDAKAKLGAQSPALLQVGGWNDGDLPGAPFQSNYQARTAAGLANAKAKGGFSAIVGVSIQPVGSGATLDANRAASLLGQQAAYLARTEAAGGDGLVRGYLDLTPMWPNVSTSGQRGNNVNSTDTIHLHSKGAESVARYIKAGIAPFTVPTSLVAAQYAAA